MNRAERYSVCIDVEQFHDNFFFGFMAVFRADQESHSSQPGITTHTELKNTKWQ